MLAELPEPRVAAARPKPVAGVERYGLGVQELTPELRARLGVEEPGVVVSGVERGGAAERAGLRPGDVILEADRRTVEEIEDLAVALETGDGPTLLLVQRGQDTVFITLSRARG